MPARTNELVSICNAFNMAGNNVIGMHTNNVAVAEKLFDRGHSKAETKTTTMGTAIKNKHS